MRRIPNWLPVTGLVIALLCRLALGPAFLWIGVQGAALAFGVSVFLFAAGVVGGGDAKLLTATGAFLGPLAWLGMLATSFVAAAGLALMVAARGGVLPLLLHNTWTLARLQPAAVREAGAARARPAALAVPFGAAIAVGGIVWLLAGSAIVKELIG